MRVLVILGLTGLGTSCFGQVFTGLGVVPGANASTANAISSDGMVVVGTSQQFGGAAWRWTQATGRVDLGAAPAGFIMEQAGDVSGDGSVIVGGMNDGVSISTAWRWTAGTGIQRVAGIGAGSFGPFISSDGSTIVGRAEGMPLSAVRWTQATGVQSLNPVTGVPIGQGSALIANGVSADGSVVVGVASAIYITFPQTINIFAPYRWTQSTGSVAILDNGQFFNQTFGAGASDISADGSVIVGYAGLSMWRWTQQSGYQILTADVPPPGSGTPHVSGDGMTAVYGQRIWTLSAGPRSLDAVLTEAGCNFSGWSNLIVTDASFNGRAFCGFGTNPAGQTEAWYATIPAPASSIALLGLCGSSIAMRRRRFQVPLRSY